MSDLNDKKKVSILVLNKVSNDTRVLKQARSLSKFFDVKIFGFDNSKDFVEDESINKISINRSRLKPFRLKPFRLKAPSLKAFRLNISKSERKNILSKIINKLAWIASKIINKLAWIASKIINKLAWIFFIFLRKPLLTIKFVRKILKNRSYYLHCHDLNSIHIGIIVKLLRFKKVYLIYDSHEIYEETPVALSRLYLRAYFKFMNFCAQFFVDNFISANDGIGAYYNKTYKKYPPAITIKNASDLVVSDRNNILHNKLNINKKIKILLFTGGLQAGRGLYILLRSVKFFPNNWKLVFIGSGKLEQNLKDLADKLNVNDKVFFLKTVKNEILLNYVKDASIGIIPYENIGLNHVFCTPNKLWEFPKANVPIIVSHLSELKKAVDTYDHGWVLPEIYDETYIGSLLDTLGDKEINKKKKNTNVFNQKDNWEIYEKKLFDLYRIY